jgi:FkbM family methyltransferase
MIKSIIKKTFNIVGYEIKFNAVGYEIKRKNLRDMFAIRHGFEEALVQLKAVGYNPDLIIDVGAADGTPPLQNVFPASYFFWIEALKEFEPALINLQQKLKGNYEITAVGRNNGSIVLNVHKDLHGSTMLEEADGETSDGTPRQIPVSTLNKLSATHNWKQFNRILLKVDVQGFELEVLEGSKEILSNVDVVILEVSFFRFLKNAPDFYDVVTYMKDIGYVVYDIVGGINRPIDYALGQKDLVFVKENGFFRQSQGWASK